LYRHLPLQKEEFLVQENDKMFQPLGTSVEVVMILALLGLEVLVVKLEGREQTQQEQEH